MAGEKRTYGSLKIATAAAFLLTLATWMYFYKAIPDAPALGAEGTTVVFGAWFCVAYATHWLWGRFFRKSRKGG